MITLLIKGDRGRPRKEDYRDIAEAWPVFCEYARLGYEVALHDETYDIEVTA